MKKLLRDWECAEYLSIGVSTVWLYSRQGKIKAIKLSDRVTVWAKADLDAFVQSKAKIA